MSAAHSRPIQTPHLKTLAVWRAQAGAFLLLGRASGPIPKAGSARVASSLAGVGVFRADYWPVANEASCAFLAVVRLPVNADPNANAELVLRGARNGDQDFRVQLVQASWEAEFGAELAGLASGHGAKLVRFMLDVMRPDDHSENRRSHALIDSFLRSTARTDGCIELILNVPGQSVLLQGWGSRLVQPTDVLLTNGKRIQFPVETCEFPRDDVQAPATGIVFVLPAEAIESFVATEIIYLLTETEILSRHVVQARALNSQESIGQIRHLLPRLIGSSAHIERLRELAQPGYDGSDTLNSSSRSVRAALDIALWRPDAGVYLSGWLFDPVGQVAKVEFCVDGDQTRIDTTMVRVSRADVSAAFSADPLCPMPPGDDWGFAVSLLRAPAPQAATYLRLTFSDGEIAFLPVQRLCAQEPVELKTLIDSVDLHKSSGVMIVESHLAPYIARCRKTSRVSGVFVVAGPVDRPRAIVVPLRSLSHPRALIANFIAGRSHPEEQIVFVCGPEWRGRPLETLASLIRFYELPASVIVTGRHARPLDALQAAGELTQADCFLIVSGLTGDLPADVRHALFEVAQDYDVLCPTVLYEDQSIRFAGESKIECHDRAPFSQGVVSSAGFAAALVHNAEISPMTGGTLACCVVRRSVLPNFTSNHVSLTEAYEELGAFSRVETANLRRGWIGSIHVTVPEESAAGVSDVAMLVDGWTLRAMINGEVKCAF